MPYSVVPSLVVISDASASGRVSTTIATPKPSAEMVDHLVGQHGHQPDVGIGFEIFGQQRASRVRSSSCGTEMRSSPLGRLCCTLHARWPRRAGRAEAARGIFEEHLALLGDGDAVGRAAQELGTQLLLESGEAPADRRFGHAEPRGRARETLQARRLWRRREGRRFRSRPRHIVKMASRIWACVASLLTLCC